MRIDRSAAPIAASRTSRAVDLSAIANELGESEAVIFSVL